MKTLLQDRAYQNNKKARQKRQRQLKTKAKRIPEAFKKKSGRPRSL